MAKNDFHYGGSYTLQFGTIVTLISSGDCTLQCGMWRRQSIGVHDVRTPQFLALCCPQISGHPQIFRSASS